MTSTEFSYYIQQRIDFNEKSNLLAYMEYFYCKNTVRSVHISHQHRINSTLVLVFASLLYILLRLSLYWPDISTLL